MELWKSQISSLKRKLCLKTQPLLLALVVIDLEAVSQGVLALSSEVSSGSGHVWRSQQGPLGGA